MSHFATEAVNLLPCWVLVPVAALFPATLRHATPQSSPRFHQSATPFMSHGDLPETAAAQTPKSFSLRQIDRYCLGFNIEIRNANHEFTTVVEC